MSETDKAESLQEQPTIHCMDDVLAARVAAGESVERPASVIKELVENSIDAGACSVRVEIERGGVALIKVDDDGCGMSRADLRLCLQRHATSKLLRFEDLYELSHLGFRGEALPSIASVSHISICTRRAADVAGSCIVSHGGREEPIRIAGCPPGTHTEVRELFYNTPARRKFLKSTETETAHAEQQVRLHALAFPGVRFTFFNGSSCIFDSPAGTDLRRRIADFYGRDLAGKLLRIRPTLQAGVRVGGYLLPLADARRNRRLQYIFLNGRPIEDKNISRAVRDGYGGLPTGLHPGYFLYLEVEPALVDVNVHPAKREVRFRRLSDVLAAVAEATAATLADHARGETGAPALPSTPTPGQERSIAPAQGESPFPGDNRRPGSSPRTGPTLRLMTEPQQTELAIPEEGAGGNPSARRGGGEPFPFRLLGLLQGGNYILFENAEGLVVVWVPAAQERIIFERIVAANKQPPPSQSLLAPIITELDARDCAVAKELLPYFARAGFRIPFFGTHTLRVEALPVYVEPRDIELVITEIIRLYSSGEVKLKRTRDPFEIFAMRLAAEYARREGVPRLSADPTALLRELLCCEIPYCTPRGKPTMIPYSLSELNRRFQSL